MQEGLLSGLESFGLGGLEGMSLFEEEKKKEQAKAVVELTEKDFLLDKSMTCPVCDAEFKARMVKGGKAKLVGQDLDLRPKYKELDITKYDVVMCPQCGYTALQRYFPNTLEVQRKRIREKICANFKPQKNFPETYTYDEAIERYKMALVNAIVKGAKASEKAYICLKSSWVVRGKAEELGEGHADYAKTKAMEAEFTKNAFEGFMAAVQSENFPMCGMDEGAINYLLAVLGYKTDHLDISQKMIATILQSSTANPRMKDKARDLKEMVVAKIKAKG
ncbi:MAG: DUF2225 domain-containing protein [Lachnospiraceae bacterium]|nr:DUF2225 domain-containing protein [Lachnospiraceae bacterium]